MTAIVPGAPTPVPGAASPGGTAAAGDLQGSASFADTLLAMLDRALLETPGPPQERFAAGTMRSSVEMFDERGFFEDRAPGGRHTPMSPLASAQPAGAAQPAFPPAQSYPVLQSDPTRAPVIAPPAGSPPVAVTTPALASDPTFDGQMPIAGLPPVAPPQSTPAERGLASTAPMSPGPVARLRTARMTVENPTQRERQSPASLYRDLSAPAASRVRVSLDHDDAGVSVSVVADIEPDTDRGAIHDAVVHMLARHGLVLSELRVAGRPGNGGQDRKD